MHPVFSRAEIRNISRWGAFISVRQLLVITILSLSLLNLGAAPIPSSKPANYPDWWFSLGVIVPLNPSDPSPSWPASYPAADDYAVVNQGQLKNFATQAYNEMQSTAPSSVWTTTKGVALTSLVTGWSPGTGDDYQAMNLGQLKSVVQAFNDAAGGNNYVWTGVSADDYAAATLGQAKNLFAPQMTGSANLLAAVNQPFSSTFTWNFGILGSISVAGSLPSGLSLDTSTGILSGTPTTLGSNTITLTANTYLGSAPSQTVTIAVVSGAPVITSPTTSGAIVSVPYSYTITTAVPSGFPVTYSATGLPSGWTINSSTGTISGTPTADGSYTITLSATDSLGTGTATLMLSVTDDLTTDLNQEVDSLIALTGTSPGTALKMFSSTVFNNHADDTNLGPYTRNTSIWTGNLDWTGCAVSWGTSGSAACQWGGALITPQDFICANHEAASNGTQLNFVDSNNVVYSATVAAGARIGTSDIYIAHLSTALPSSVKHYKVFPANFANYLPNNATWPVVHCCTFGTYNSGVYHQALLTQGSLAIADSNSNINFSPSLTPSSRIPYAYTDAPLPTPYLPYPGCSGSPTFAICRGEPVLLGAIHTSEGAPSISAYYDAINAALSSLGSSYTLTPADLSSFGTY